MGGLIGANNGGHKVEEGSQGAVEREGASSNETGMDVERDKVYDKGWGWPEKMREGEPWLLIAMFGHTSMILLHFMDS